MRVTDPGQVGDLKRQPDPSPLRRRRGAGARQELEPPRNHTPIGKHVLKRTVEDVNHPTAFARGGDAHAPLWGADGFEPGVEGTGMTHAPC